jgi:hypothetical protein
METTQDAVAILRLMVAPYGNRIEAKALVHAIEELTRRQTLPAENEKIRASRDKWREVAEQFVDGLTKNDDKILSGAVKAYTKLIKAPANAPAQ